MVLVPSLGMEKGPEARQGVPVQAWQSLLLWAAFVGGGTCTPSVVFTLIPTMLNIKIVFIISQTIKTSPYLGPR